MWMPLPAQLLFQLFVTALMLCLALLGVCQRRDLTLTGSTQLFELVQHTNTGVAQLWVLGSLARAAPWFVVSFLSCEINQRATIPVRLQILLFAWFNPLVCRFTCGFPHK